MHAILVGMDRKPHPHSAYRTATALYTHTFDSLRLFVRDPATYADIVCALDDDDTIAGQEQFTDAMVKRAKLTPPELNVLNRMGDISGVLPGEDFVAMRRWARTKTIYQLDPDTAHAVEHTDWSDTIIPGDVLRRIPHVNPLVVLPEPLYAPSDTAHAEKYVAFLISGVRRKPGDSSRIRTDTCAPDATHLVIRFLGYVINADGSPVVVDQPDLWGTVRNATVLVAMRILTPLTDASMSTREQFVFDDVSEETYTRLGWSDRSAANAATVRMTQLALSTLTYICSDNADVNTEKRSSVKLSRAAVKAGFQDGTPATVVNVGFRVGAALRQHQVSATRAATSATTGRRMAPHFRRAHAHRYRVGPGRRKTIIKWLPPIAVNPSGAPPTPTVHTL